MKLGVFDSGLGGLLITRAIRDQIPDIDILYYGDTLHVPYGNRSEDAIYMYTQRAMDYMFAQGCKLIVLACNTASATALRRLQQFYLPAQQQGRNIIGVVVPTLEAAIAAGYQSLGLIGTSYMVRSNVYAEELRKLNPALQIRQLATPLLVPMIENNGMAWIDGPLRAYLKYFDGSGMQCLLLGCTHYPLLKENIRAILGGQIALLSQEEIIPAKLQDYLVRHPEYDSAIVRNGQIEFQMSDLTPSYIEAARQIYGADINISKSEQVFV